MISAKAVYTLHTGIYATYRYHVAAHFCRPNANAETWFPGPKKTNLKIQHHITYTLQKSLYGFLFRICAGFSKDWVLAIGYENTLGTQMNTLGTPGYRRIRCLQLAA